MSLEDIEKRVDEAVARLENRLENLSKEIEEKVAAALKPIPRPYARMNRSSSFWGLVLVIIGAILLANHFDWFDSHIPLIPAALIALGIYLLVENRG